jgi:hypothetical protein
MLEPTSTSAMDSAAEAIVLHAFGSASPIWQMLTCTDGVNALMLHIRVPNDANKGV